MNYIYPKKIVLCDGAIKNREALLQKRILQVGLAEKCTAVLEGPAFIVLDFGRELSGGIRLLTHRAEGRRRIRLRFGESLSEACAELGEKNATNDHSLRDMTVELPDYSDMTFGETGFRFVRIDVREGDSVAFKSVIAAIEEDERIQVGHFECDDPLVNKIWDTAAYTLRLCLRNGFFWDGIKRDRLVWVGDLYPEMKAAFRLYGDVPETENSLLFAREQTPLPEWMNGIPMYSMWWLIALWENFYQGGNRAFAEGQLDYAEGLISLFECAVDEDGETHFGYNFIDWATHFEPGGEETKRGDESAGVNYLLRLALMSSAKLFRAFGRDDGKCGILLEKLNRSCRRAEKYKQIAALGVLAGEKSAHNREILLRGGAAGMSTFMSYEILSACAAFGEYESAMRMLKDYYGGMLSLGATTFWEDFDIKWAENAARIDTFPKDGQTDVHGDCGAFCYKGFRHSLCHGWSAGVLAYLSETVLGLIPEDVGGRKIRFAPHPGGLGRACGILPTSFGPVEVEWRSLPDGKTEKRILRVPKEVEVID